jgi:hypothetical protein
MWQEIANEMEIPWKSVESMHWQLGKPEMSALANSNPSATILSSSQLEPALLATQLSGEATDLVLESGFTIKKEDKDECGEVVKPIRC